MIILNKKLSFPEKEIKDPFLRAIYQEVKDYLTSFKEISCRFSTNNLITNVCNSNEYYRQCHECEMDNKETGGCFMMDELKHIEYPIKNTKAVNTFLKKYDK